MSADEGRSSTPATAGEVVTAYLGAQLAQLEAQDPRVRVAAPDSVHRMRVAARRARSALATYAPLLERDRAAALRDELRWLGSVLGEARDAEVMLVRFEGLLAEQPESLTRGLVTRRITYELDARVESGMANVARLLDSERYHRLRESFKAFVGAPPLTERAARPAEEEVVRLVERDLRRLSRRAKRARDVSGRRRRDAALHEVRKAAKRLRYSAESAVPVLGRRAELLAKSCAAVQDALGEHQDSAVARALLRTVEVDAVDAGSDAVFAELHAREAARAQGSEEDYLTVLATLPRRHLHRWLQDT